MSIISDALKKAQARRERKEEAATGQVDDAPVDDISLESLPGATVPRAKSFLQDKRFIIPLAGLITVALIGTALLTILVDRAKTAVKTAQPATRKAPRKPARPAAPARTSAPVPREPAAAKEAQPITAQPTAPPEQPETFQVAEPVELPIVGGIMYSPGHSQAILNGSMVSEGDTVGGFRVKEILPSTVKVSHRGKEYELELR